MRCRLAVLPRYGARAHVRAPGTPVARVAYTTTRPRARGRGAGRPVLPASDSIPVPTPGAGPGLRVRVRTHEGPHHSRRGCPGRPSMAAAGEPLAGNWSGVDICACKPASRTGCLGDRPPGWQLACMMNVLLLVCSYSNQMQAPVTALLPVSCSVSWVVRQ